MPDIIITPNSGLIDFFPVSSRVSRIEASGNTFNLVNTANPSGIIFNIEATNGSLFSVVDNLSGTLMSVNNNAGLPVFEVFSDDRIVGGRFGQNDLVVTSGGNIGLGISTPSGKLHVIGDVTASGFVASSGTAALPTFDFVNDSDTGMFNPSANILGFSTSGVERLRINDVGNVGIGTTTPNQVLDVNGNISCRRLYLESLSSASIVSSGLTLSLANSQLFTVNLNSNITTVTISNTPNTSGTAVGFSLIFTADGTARSVTWPTGVKWAGNSAPALTSTSGKIDVLSFVTTNGGTNWLGFVGGQNY